MFQKQESRGVVENNFFEHFDDIHRITCDDNDIQINVTSICLVSWETYKIVKYCF